MLAFNLVKILEAEFGSKATVTDAFPDAESASLPIIVVQSMESVPTPAQLGSKLENMRHSFVIHVLGANKGQRDYLLDEIYFYLRDTNLNFYQLKVENGLVVLDTTRPVTGIRVIPQRIRKLPAISEHPYDRYRGYVEVILEQMI